MSYTKRQFVTEAYTELGMADYVFDLQPEQLLGACRRLDAMLAEWNGRGINLGYTLPTSPENTDIDQETTVPDWANEAIVLNLAVKIAPMHGKTVAMETKTGAKLALNTVMINTAKDVVMKLPADTPIGAGYKRMEYPFIDETVDTGFIDEPGEELTFEAP